MATFTPDSALVDSTALSPNRTVTGGRYARLVVIHTMETGETSAIAENIGGGWFTQVAAYSSAHYNIDNNSVVQGVPEKDMAWAAPGTNEDGIQIEHAGVAAQTWTDWNDSYSLAMLERSARLVADICKRNDIPPVRLSNAQLAAGAKGIIDHGQASAVYRLSDHYDVGAGFPWDWYIGRVQAYYGGAVAQSTATFSTTTSTQDWFDMSTRKDLEEVLFTTKRPEWGGRNLIEMLNDNNRDTYSTLRMVRHLFNLYRLGIPSVITDGTFGAKLRSLVGYNEAKQGAARKSEHEADRKSNFRW